MKLITLSALCCLLSVVAFSQDFLEGRKGYTLLYAGIGGAGGRYQGVDIDSKFSAGFGLEQIARAGKRLLLRGSVQLNRRGYKSPNGKLGVTYLDVPIGFEYIFNPKTGAFFLGGGAYGGVALFGKYPGGHFKFGENISKNRSRFDMGYYISLGTYSFLFGKLAITGNYGLKNVVPADRQAADGKLRLTSGMVSLSIPLAIFSKKS